MTELKGQLSILDAIKDELEGEPSAARAIKILDEAAELGWAENPFASLVIRLTREDALPFYARWDMSCNPETGKRRWRFAGARAINGQPLAYGDIKTYLEDPSVIYPEPPSDPEDDTEESVKTALGALKILTEPDPAYKDGPPAPAGIPPLDWGALLS